MKLIQNHSIFILSLIFKEKIKVCLIAMISGLKIFLLTIPFCRRVILNNGLNRHHKIYSS